MSEQGVPRSVLVGEDHMQVRAPLVALLKSANAALVWTRIEYRVKHVAYAHERDGLLWWEVTARDLAVEVGLSADQVDRALAKLVEGSYLLAEQHSLPMQTLSYSPVIAQSAKSPIGGDLREIADSSPRNRDVQSAKSRIPPLYQEREEVEEVSTSAAIASHDALTASGRVKKPTKTATDFDPEIIRLCDLLAELVRKNDHRVETVGPYWWNACERLMRLDKYTPEQIEIIIRWATADEFWAGNIRSMHTLREKFSTLRAQRNTRLSGKKRGTVATSQAAAEILRARREQREMQAVEA